ncbi:hypothetical protein KGO95_01065 [Patescibacteria group bacterium]|nr:hypothetical protein [Patescibacteria group bacterium]
MKAMTKWEFWGLTAMTLLLFIGPHWINKQYGLATGIGAAVAGVLAVIYVFNFPKPIRIPPTER